MRPTIPKVYAVELLTYREHTFPPGSEVQHILPPNVLLSCPKHGALAFEPPRGEI